MATYDDDMVGYWSSTEVQPGAWATTFVQSHKGDRTHQHWGIGLWNDNASAIDKNNVYVIVSADPE